MRTKVDFQLKLIDYQVYGREILDRRRRCGERKWACGWRKIPLHYDAIIRLHIRYYCCFMEEYSIFTSERHLRSVV